MRSGKMGELQQKEETLMVLLAQQGDGEAFRSLVEVYDRRLLYFIRRILEESEDSFDVLQDVWLKVHRNLPNLRAPVAFRSWIFRIAHDQAISQIRRTRRLIPLGPLGESPLEEVPDTKIPDSIFESADQVHAALKSLSLDHRRVLTLRFLEDMSLAEIATVLSCSSGTVKSRLHYAKAAMARRIQETQHE